MKRFALAALLILSGCSVCDPDISYERPVMQAPWDTTYLLDADPSSVTKDDLAAHADKLEEHYWTYAQVNGICWPPTRSDPGLDKTDSYTSGGDSALFTGYALAASVWRYKVTGLDFDKIVRSLEGMYLITHATGTPGVVARCTFPADEPEKFYYPKSWTSRIERGFVNTGPALESPLRPGVTFKPQTYYTRATADQMTGVVFGLAVTWNALEGDTSAEAIKVRTVVAEIMEALYNHLQKHDWNIRDEKGENQTNADGVDGLLRSAFLSLYRSTAVITNPARVGDVMDDYEDTLASFLRLTDILAIGDRFNNFMQYYAHNLRVSRAYTVWLLGDADDKKKMREYCDDNMWNFVKGHQNAWFSYLAAAMGSGDVDEGYAALQSLSLKPLRSWSSPLKGQEVKPSLLAVLFNCTEGYVRPPHLRKPTKYATWQKEPWDVSDNPGFDTKAVRSNTGGGYLSAYWLARYHGFID